MALPSTPLDRDELRQLLDHHAERINTPDFIAADPVQFPRRYSSLHDIEIASLLAATLAWGRRDMICRDCTRLFSDVMSDRPYEFVKSGAYENLPDFNIHRTFFSANLRYYLRGLAAIYRRHGSLADFARAAGIAKAPYPSFELAARLGNALAEANGGLTDSRCLPVNLSTTPLKRLNMALRWLVRQDGIVDMGVWDSTVMSPSQLVIPLDVHVARTSRALGLLTRASDDRRSAEIITSALASFRPDDPVLYDFALFGLGVESAS